MDKIHETTFFQILRHWTMQGYNPWERHKRWAPSPCVAGSNLGPWHRKGNPAEHSSLRKLRRETPKFGSWVSWNLQGKLTGDGKDTGNEFQKSAQRARRQWNNTFSILKEKTVNLELCTPSNNFFQKWRCLSRKEWVNKMTDLHSEILPHNKKEQVMDIHNTDESQQYYAFKKLYTITHTVWFCWHEIQEQAKLIWGVKKE